MAIPTPAGSVDLGFIGPTHSATVTATPAHFNPTGSATSYAVMSDTACHLSTSGSDATTDDFMLLPGVYAIVNIDRFSDQQLSWVVADTASDGNIRITEVNPKV